MRPTSRSFGLLLPAVACLTFACGGDSTGPDDPSGPPVVLSINGATQPSGPTGSTVIIEGSNFGGVRGTSQVLFSDGAGGTIPASITGASDWTANFIVTLVPAGAASGSVVVQTSLGSSIAIPFGVTQNSAFSPSTISWTATTELPVAVSGHALAFAQLAGSAPIRVVYSLGGAGANGVPVNTVYFASVGAGAGLSGWAATLPLPASIAFHAAVVATPGNSRVTSPGYLYALGGASDAAGTPSSVVYRGALAANGTVSAWVTATALPAALRSAGVVIFQGDLYVVGGATTGNTPVATVYRSRIEAGGGLGAWQAQASLPFPRVHFGFGAFGGTLYAFGGDSGVVAPHSGTQASSSFADVAYARIDLRSKNLMAAGWSSQAGQLTKSRDKHTAVVAGGNVLITAGLYNGAGSGASEESYAQLNADGSAGSFHGATGSNTIASLVSGANLFNHAVVGYVDGAGVFHVLVAGGDDVNNPGVRRKGVFFY